MFTRRFFTRNLLALLSNGKKIGLITSSLPYNGQFFLWLKKQQETIWSFSPRTCVNTIFMYGVIDDFDLNVALGCIKFTCTVGGDSLDEDLFSPAEFEQPITKSKMQVFRGLNNFQSTDILIYCKIHWFCTMNRCIWERILLHYKLSLDLDHNYRGNTFMTSWDETHNSTAIFSTKKLIRHESNKFYNSDTFEPTVLTYNLDSFIFRARKIVDQPRIAGFRWSEICKRNKALFYILYVPRYSGVNGRISGGCSS